jgi:GNAT superfamily N-acetyltransferase
VITRTARPDDLPAVLALVGQHRRSATAERVLTGRVAGVAAAEGFRRLLADPAHQVVLAVLPHPDAHGGSDRGPGGGAVAVPVVVGLAVFGTDPLSVVLGAPQVTVDWFVVHREHRRRGVGVALLAAAAAHAGQVGAEHVVATVGGQEAERQRFLARMGFAPLTTRRIVSRAELGRQLSAWGRGWPSVPAPRRRGLPRRRVGAVPGVLSGSPGQGD